MGSRIDRIVAPDPMRPPDGRDGIAWQLDAGVPACRRGRRGVEEEAQNGPPCDDCRRCRRDRRAVPAGPGACGLPCPAEDYPRTGRPRDDRRRPGRPPGQGLGKAQACTAEEPGHARLF